MIHPIDLPALVLKAMRLIGQHNYSLENKGNAICPNVLHKKYM